MTDEEFARFDALMEIVCVRMGFCGSTKRSRPLHVIDLIPRGGGVTADFFADLVFIADGMNPHHDLAKWQTQKDAIAQAFRDYMGADAVPANCLHYHDDPDF